MRLDKPAKSEAAFVSDKEVKRNAGYTDIKRDGLVKDISTSLYDVDYAVKWHLENVITPTIVEENAVLTVPVMYAAGEKWASVQKHGFLRDSQGKLLTPLIMIRRNSVTKREDIQDLKVLETSDARITFERKYTQRNRYSRFDLAQRPKEREFYSNYLNYTVVSDRNGQIMGLLQLQTVAEPVIGDSIIIFTEDKEYYLTVNDMKEFNNLLVGNE